MLSSLVVGLDLKLDFVSGWLVAMHTYYYITFRYHSTNKILSPNFLICPPVADSKGRAGRGGRPVFAQYSPKAAFFGVKGL